MAASSSVAVTNYLEKVKLITKDNKYYRITDLFYNTNNTNDQLPLAIPVAYRPPFSELVNAPDKYLVYIPGRISEIPFGLYVAFRDRFNPNPRRYVVWGFAHKVKEPKNPLVLFKLYNSSVRRFYFESCRSFVQIMSAEPVVKRRYMPIIKI